MTIKTRKRIRPRSQAMTARMKVYNERKAIFLAQPENRLCQAMLKFWNHAFGLQHPAPLPPATQVHHSRGRAGALLLDERWWIPVSMTGHQMIQNNPDLARKLGLLCELGCWNKPIP